MTLADYLFAQRGRSADLARYLGVPPSLISQWARNRRRVPAGRCLPIEWHTKGRVKASTLRPDLSFKRRKI